MAVSKRLAFATVSLISFLGLTNGFSASESLYSAMNFDRALDMEMVSVSPELLAPTDGKPDFEKLFESMKGFQDCYLTKTDFRYILGDRKYDCRDNLKDDGEWKKADKAMVVFLKKASRDIKAIADEYGIDARPMVGAALTEASLNSKSKGNRMIDALKSMGMKDETVLDLGKLAGRNVSLGLGAMNERGACEALPVRQAIEKDFAVGLACPARDHLPDAIRGSIGNTVQSLRYMAGLMRLGQDAYFAKGNVHCDVSENMGAMITLYNMGRMKERAARSQCHKGGSVGWNYLGLWAEKNRDIIEDIVGHDYKAAIVSTPAIPSTK